MEKEFIPYELALRMKKLGFDYNILGFYYDKNSLEHCCGDTKVKDLERGEVAAPTFSQAFRFFRKNYRLSVNIHDCLDDFEAIITQWTLSDNKIVKEFPQRADISYPNNRFDSYEEAEQACLEKLIEIVESEKK
jgi:hypothetical protein